MWWLAVWCNTDYPFHLIIIIIVRSRSSSIVATTEPDRVIRSFRWIDWFDANEIREAEKQRCDRQFVFLRLFFGVAFCHRAEYHLINVFVFLASLRVLVIHSFWPNKQCIANFISYTVNLHAVKLKFSISAKPNHTHVLFVFIQNQKFFGLIINYRVLHTYVTADNGNTQPSSLLYTSRRQQRGGGR